VETGVRISPEALGHCGDCPHGRRNLLQGAEFKSQIWRRGDRGLEGPTNITPRPGVGHRRLVQFSAGGLSLDRNTRRAAASAAGPMGEAVDDKPALFPRHGRHQRLDSLFEKAFRRSTTAKALPRRGPSSGTDSAPRSHQIPPAMVRPSGCILSRAPVSVATSFDGGGHGLGSCRAFAGNRSVNDREAVNLTQVLFPGCPSPTRRTVRSSCRPFGEGYFRRRNRRCLPTILRAGFGMSASAVTHRTAVAKRRPGQLAMKRTRWRGDRLPLQCKIDGVQKVGLFERFDQNSWRRPPLLAPEPARFLVNRKP